MKCQPRPFLLLLASLVFAPPALRAADFAVATAGGGYVDAGLGGGAALPNNWTFSAWVYFTEGGSYDTGDSPVAVATSQESIAGGLSAEVLIDADTNGLQRLELGRSNGFIGEHSTLAIPTNVWTHIAVSVSATKVVRYFINGQDAGVFATEFASRDVSLGNTGSGLIRFMGNNGINRKFRGGLDYVQIWNTERSAAEIRAAMTTAPVGNEPNLVAWYRFDAGAGTIATNSDTLNASGAATLVNTVTWVKGVRGNIVTNINNAGAGSLRQTITEAQPGAIIGFAPALNAQTITLASEIVLTNDVALDASDLSGGITVSGNNVSRLFTVSSEQTVAFTRLTLTGGNGAGTINSGTGGAIESAGVLTLNQCTLSGNSTSDGGAIRNVSGVLTLNACTLSGNQATTGGGGGLYNFGGVMTLTSCTLSTNSGRYGGAIVANGGTLALTHCTIALNRSLGAVAGTDGGGGIDNFGGSDLTMTACILAGNTATTGTGPELWWEDGTVVVTNCLVGNGADAGLVNGVAGNLVGSSGAPLNARLAPLGNYGGPTRTMPLLPNSPAIDAAGLSSLVTDQRGFPRTVGVAADIGAVEGVYNAAGPGNIRSLTRLGSGAVRLAFTNSTDILFTVLASTNAAAPVATWSNLGVAVEPVPGSGDFQFTDLQATNYPERFYRVKSP